MTRRSPIGGAALDRYIEQHGTAIADRYRSGATIAACCAEFAVSRHTIEKVLRRLGVERLSGGQTVLAQSPLRDEDVRQLLDQGCTIREIADRLGVSYQAVHARIRTRGWRDDAHPEMAERRPGKLGDQRMLEIADATASGALDQYGELTALAQRLNVSSQNIKWHRDRMREAGWHCKLRWTLCAVCGEPACTAKAPVAVHPRCAGRYHTLRMQRSEHGDPSRPNPAPALTREQLMAWYADQLPRCIICGNPILGSAANIQTHPGACRRERNRQLSAENRARRRERGLTSTEYVRKWRAEHPDLVVERRRQAAPQHRAYLRAHRTAEENEQRLDALAEADRERQGRTRQHNTNHASPWTDDEDRRLIEWNGSETQEALAIRLGRTLTAVRSRRLWLRKRGLIEG